jgi:hypothetical protein
MDLEEAYVLTLLRGPSSIFGVCPICHVPHNHQHNITGSSSWELRNSHHARTVYNEARSLLSHRGGVTMSNELLKNNGTYLIEVSKNFTSRVRLLHLATECPVGYREF